MKFIFQILFVLFVTLNSCKNSIGKDELIQHLNEENNHLVFKENINGIEYKIIYKPQALIVEQFKSLSQKQKDSLETEYQKYLYFTLSVSVNKQDVFSYKIDNVDYDELNKRMCFNIENYIQLTDDRNSNYELINSVFPKLYGMTNSSSIQLTFLKGEKKLQQAYYLKIKDFVFNEPEECNFTFKQQDIVNIPTIN